MQNPLSSPAIRSCVRLLWYCAAPTLPHARERILPRGEMQIILNPVGDALRECSVEPVGAVCPFPPSTVVGPRGQYDLADTRNLAELLGVVFWPGNAAPFLRDARGCSLRAATFRTLLRKQTSPMRKLVALERWLTDGLDGRLPQRKPVIIHALALLKLHSVHDAARLLSISERRLHQMLKAEVGLSPKLWSRVQRFQNAIRLLHAVKEPRWEQLMPKCGFYDQSNFCNDFRAFSGIDPSTYAASHRLWVRKPAKRGECISIRSPEIYQPALVRRMAHGNG